jgi:Ulp1 family protease
LSGKDSTGIERWTNGVDIFSFDILFFPINNDAHWSLVAVDLRTDFIGYFDSMEFDIASEAVKVGKEYTSKIL